MCFNAKLYDNTEFTKANVIHFAFVPSLLELEDQN